jgi:importin subunit alpha-2
MLNPNKVSFYAQMTICNIVSGSVAQTDSVLAAGVCPLLTKLLVHTSSPCTCKCICTCHINYTIEYAARIVSEIAAGNETQIQALVTNNVIRPLVDVLSNVDFKRQKQAARAITNIACGNLFQFYWC